MFFFFCCQPFPPSTSNSIGDSELCPHPTLYILKLGGNGFMMLWCYCGCFLDGTLVADPGSDQTQVSSGIAKSHRRCMFSLECINTSASKGRRVSCLQLIKFRAPSWVHLPLPATEVYCSECQDTEIIWRVDNLLCLFLFPGISCALNQSQNSHSEEVDMSALGCDGPLVVLLDVFLIHVPSHVRCRVVFSCLCSPFGSYASCLICMSSFSGTIC